MNILPIIVICVLAAAGLAVLNHGPMDRKSRREQAYWARLAGK